MFERVPVNVRRGPGAVVRLVLAASLVAGSVLLQPYDLEVARGIPTPEVTLTGGTLPPGLALNSAGHLAGTPTMTGVYSFELTAKNGVSPDAVEQVTIKAVWPAPWFTAFTPPKATVGVPYSFTFTADGVPAPTFAVTGGALPGGLTLDPAGVLSGTPTTAGTSSFDVIAVNLAGAVGVTARLVVDPAPVAPVFTSAGQASFAVGSAGTFAVTTSGYPAAAISAVGLPVGLSLTDNGDGTATVAGTPAGTGTSVVTLTGVNGSGSVTQVLSVVVTSAPVITSAAAGSFTVGTAGRLVVTTSGYPASVLTVSGALPAGLSFTDNGDGTGVIAGTPTVAGTSSVTVTATQVEPVPPVPPTSPVSRMAVRAFAPALAPSVYGTTSQVIMLVVAPAVSTNPTTSTTGTTAGATTTGTTTGTAGTLANTGDPVLVELLTAFGLITAGGLLLLVRRRRIS